MASTLQTSFERSLDRFRRELSDDQQKQMHGVDQQALIDTIQDIQGKLGRENDLCKLTRIQRFLRAMEHIEKLVNIFLNASDFVAFIWGPIKLALMIATTWTDAVRQLIDAYEEIAEALGNLAFFHKLIKSNAKRLFKWAWGSFRREVKPILESLKRKQSLLTDDKLQSHAILKEVQDSDQHAKDHFGKLHSSLDDIRANLASEQLKSRTLQDREMRAYLESRLNVSKSRTDLLLEAPHPMDGVSGNWIFSDPNFESWEANKSSNGSVLFLNGSPGSGKSTLAKTIIRQLKQKQGCQSPAQSLFAYFFFKHDAADRRTTRSMLQHIIMQLSNADETVMRFAHETLSNLESTELTDLKGLAKDCFISQQTATLVLDGLDEAVDNEPEISITWCLDELLPTAAACGCTVKILICGQRDGRLDALLSSQPQIRLEMVDAHQKDIEQFTKGQAANIRERFLLTQEEEESLVAKILSASKGMFLYARVVLENLKAMDSIQEFEDELDSDAFPEDLDQAYGRITQRVLKKNGPSRHKTVKKILGMVICATRPLRWREIQSRFCIDAEKEICNIRNLRRDSCKSICSSLIDVTNCDLFPNIESEQVIGMVHETAARYLILNGTINLMQEHVEMSLFCCRYLSSRPISKSKSQSMHNDIPLGYFGFLDYASAHYAFHIEKSSSLKASRDSHFKLESIKGAEADLVQAVCSQTSSQTVENGKISQNLNLAVQENVVAVRAVIDSRYDVAPDASLRELGGPRRHKCPRLQCSKFDVGFLQKGDLDRHFNSHERPFRCNDTNCFAHVTGYTSREELQNHLDVLHQTEGRAQPTFPVSSKNGEWDIYEACRVGNMEEVKRFHREGVNLDESTLVILTLINIALKAGHGDICQYLVSNGVNPFKVPPMMHQSHTPIFKAIKCKRLEILELFLSSGYAFDDMQVVASSIAMAILENNPPALKVLLSARRLLDNTTEAQAPDRGSTDQIRMLLENKTVDLFSRDNEGRTAFSYLIFRFPVHDGKAYLSNLKVLECLFQEDKRLAWTADKSEEGLTPLHHAMKPFNWEVPQQVREKRGEVAIFLLKCSEMEQVLTTYLANSTVDERKRVREFARDEGLEQAVECMNKIGF
ncbi:heterokaryon incompatibility protein het-E-1 [Fusarium beomiforme]|uniref:Heterokaryon incompatibility protein het-E-1 n=1 Tax=Fusarium beomiforme TaxID=44412 RepID=A0A9P5DX93_9HYPO|nr:heterokaryon incompatibility protein het-E-1 [Fusarium beomiforme]